MVTTLRIIESPPTAYPDIPGLIDGIDPATVWARLESWIGWRWNTRAVVFTVEGPGDWSAPLCPATFGVTEIWKDDAWGVVTLQPSAFGGLFLPECAHYRIGATVGAVDAPPPIVLEAARRLGAYLKAVASRSFENAILTKESSDEIDSFEYAPPANAAKALQYSGAADLLRRFRRPPGAEVAA